jgi:exosortase/archaeosortase
MRTALHFVLSILMWCLFGYYWHLVVQQQISRHSLESLAMLSAFTLLVLAVTLWWIAHNKRIASRGKRKNLMPAPPEPFEMDNLQRPIKAPPLEQLKVARRVLIRVDDAGNKVYAATPQGDA